MNQNIKNSNFIFQTGKKQLPIMRVTEGKYGRKAKREEKREERRVRVDVGGCSARTYEISLARGQDHSLEIISTCRYSLTKLKEDMARDDKAGI